MQYMSVSHYEKYSNIFFGDKIHQQLNDSMGHIHKMIEIYWLPLLKKITLGISNMAQIGPNLLPTYVMVRNT